MIVHAAVFTCSICGEPSTNICAYCTKDACANHRCERCKRCSDCCECDVPLSAAEPVPEPIPDPPAEVTPHQEPSVVAEPLEVTGLDESPHPDHDDLSDPIDLPDSTDPHDPAA
jgi:hypothetical protein